MSDERLGVAVTDTGGLGRGIMVTGLEVAYIDSKPKILNVFTLKVYVNPP
jgi:hypothetical protein